MALNMAKAQALMTDPNFWNNVDSVEKSKNHGKKSVSHEQDMAPSYNTMMYEQAAYAQNRTTQPKFSSEIMESFKEMPPIEYGGGSVLDEIPASFMGSAAQSMERMGGIPANMTPRQQVTNQRMGQPMTINEVVQQPMGMPQQMPMGGAIDYNYIKYLIGEAIKENMKTMVNESKNGLYGLVLKGGNKIQLLDQQGDLYEAELKLKRRAK